MGAPGLSVLLLAVDSMEVLLVVDCVLSLKMECVLMSSSGSELVDFCEVLVESLSSLDSLDTGHSGLDSGLDSAVILSGSSLAAV